MDGFTKLANAMAGLMQPPDRVRVGQVAGGNVIVDGRSLPADYQVDVSVSDGDYVSVLIDDTGGTAVVIGK